eukprot:gene14139-4148_t
MAKGGQVSEVWIKHCSGDCWFLASIAALAETLNTENTTLNADERINRLFGRPDNARERDSNTDPNTYLGHDCGGVVVNLNKGGWWHQIVVDTYLPAKGRTPKYSKNKEEPDELWVAVLEKAYAKIHGEYACIVGGDCGKGLTDLSGFPSFSFQLPNPNEIQ